MTSLLQFERISNGLSNGISNVQLFTLRGRVIQVVGTIIKVSMPGVRLGDLCRLISSENENDLFAEVVGFSQDYALLTPIGEMEGISTSTFVINTGDSHKVPVGMGLLGRMLNGLGEAQDLAEKGPLQIDGHYPVNAEAPSPFERKVIDKVIPLGVKVIDSMLTCGEGQRMGIFAAAGCGKSTLLGMIVRGAVADVVVIALIGERGREVREFTERELDAQTSDRSAMERVKAAYVATAVAESYRDKGKKVLLLMDSLTRFARALREIGLAAGEPPARRGFPPSVFANLPKLLERSGNNKSGSITALYTVLVEGDDMSEPVADEVRSILDGHIILSRALSESGHYPAIDVLASASRVMTSIVSPDHQAMASEVRNLMANYKENELLIKIGEYQSGTNAITDMAIAKREEINKFLTQSTSESIPMETTIKQLKTLLQ